MNRYLISFLPWIAYAFVATSDDWRNGAEVGLAIALVVIYRDRRTGKHWDEMVIEVSAAVFFAGITWLSYKDPDSSLIPYGPALVDAWLALTAFGSLAIGRPFTLGIARRIAPEKVWKTKAFFRTNAVITTVWGVSFAGAAAALAVLIHHDPKATTASIVIKVVSFLIPVMFTMRYPATVAARQARSAHQPV
ncbi:hypothetical protein VR41_09010 [Streptomyces sp. NRRL B-1568]|uniref:Intracellular septation protein A n=1 Tax=Streptomyces olivoverticillatus TaxID=66427 RepID=A0A7W7LLG4_9ACTN|nr:hypothetical protein [Streptomyces olivoverticillatus]KJY42194.1 hypothetical protein VR41_09010 [Streptomyces sp. NRRL B-1568]MBB4892347.1 hypothetical protein [Streptomyces olivoverticillatus]